MARPFPQVASFLLALLTVYAGLATAQPREDVSRREIVRVPERGPAMEAPGELVLPTLSAVPAVPGPWHERVAARLAEVSRRASARRGGPVVGEGDPTLRQRLAELVRRAGPAIGVHVEDLDSGASLFEQNSGARLNPASNHKLVTAIAAVELLGPDYRFVTRVVRDGDAIVIVGDGDPSLQIQGLHELAARVVAAGAHVGARRVVVDASAFTPERWGPGFEEPPREGPSYLAPSGALSLSFNTVEVTVSPQGHGRQVSVEVAPASAHVAVESRARVGRGRPLAVESTCAGEATTIAVRGALRRKATIRRRICEPGRFTGEAFAALLEELGGSRLPVETGEASPAAREVAALRSPPLVEILASALKYSNNFTSEQVLRTLGRRMSGEPGSWENGRAALAAFWRAAGNDPAELVLENGSGLSVRGRVSPRGLVRVLALTRDEGSPAATLLPALATAGGEGTLRMRIPAGRGRVRGKTGTIGGVSALSGVVATPDGRRALGFSVLINDRRRPAAHSRALQDRIVLSLLAHLDKTAEPNERDR